MKDPHEKPIFEQTQTQIHQDYKQTNMSPLDFPFPTRHLPGKEVYKSKESPNIFEDCIYEADSLSKPTSHREINDILSGVGDLNDISPMDMKDLTDENLMEAVDLSDLSLSCNDFILGDCTCFEEASQLVDPALKDSESTPLSFNNSDSVQLFRHSLGDSFDDNLSNFIKNTDNLFNYKNNSERCDWTIGGGSGGGGGVGAATGTGVEDVDFKSDHFNFYHVFEMFDNNMNVSIDEKPRKDEPIQRKVEKVVRSKTGIKRRPQIQKGRSYLASFREKVLEYAQNHTFKETALHFNINCNTITDWSRDSKRLTKEVTRTTSLPGSDYNNYKTDIVGTPPSKTEIILLNDDFSLETDFNVSSSSSSSSSLSLTKSSLTNIEEDLPAVDMKPDERFLKWIEGRRVEGKELTRPEVFQMAKCCLRKSGGNYDVGSWFVQWFKRFNKALRENPAKSEGETEKYIKYPVKFKLEVALYARIFTKNSAARVFNVSRRRTFDWFSRLTPQKDSFAVNTPGDHLVAMTENERIAAFQVKKDETRSRIYSELHLWYQKRFLNGTRPTSYEIKEKAREIFASRGVTGVKFSDGWLDKFCQRMNIKLRHSEDDRLLMWVLTQFDNNVSLSHQEITEKSSSLIGRKQFKGSKGWTLRFLKRHKNLFQNCPTVQDQLPQIVQDKLNFFWTEFKQSLISLELEPGRIGCMDEIPLSFTYPEGGKSAKLPLLRKTGFENCQGVVILCTLANGRILPPAVVFKGNGPKQLLSDRDVEILILYQENGLITTDILLAWANDIWLSCTQTPNALVVDSFEPHCTKELRQMLAKEKSLLHIIPEGCSSRFQPLDVEVTPLFKEAIKKEWMEFPVNEGSCSLKVMKKYRCPDQDTILRWVQKAYEKIKQNPLFLNPNPGDKMTDVASKEVYIKSSDGAIRPITEAVPGLRPGTPYDWSMAGAQTVLKYMSIFVTNINKNHNKIHWIKNTS